MTRHPAIASTLAAAKVHLRADDPSPATTLDSAPAAEPAGRSPPGHRRASHDRVAARTNMTRPRRRPSS